MSEINYDKDFGEDVFKVWEDRRYMYHKNQDHLEQYPEFYNPLQKHILSLDILAETLMKEIVGCSKGEVIYWLVKWKKMNPKSPYFFC